MTVAFLHDELQSDVRSFISCLRREESWLTNYLRETVGEKRVVISVLDDFRGRYIQSPAILVVELEQLSFVLLSHTLFIVQLLLSALSAHGASEIGFDVEMLNSQCASLACLHLACALLERVDCAVLERRLIANLRLRHIDQSLDCRT